MTVSWYSALWIVFWTFLGLKLGGVVDWSWWAVTAPLWPVGVMTAGALLIFAGVVATGVATTKKAAKSPDLWEKFGL